MYWFISDFYIQMGRHKSSLSDYPQTLSQICYSSQESPMQSESKGAVVFRQLLFSVSHRALAWPRFVGNAQAGCRLFFPLRRSRQLFPIPLAPVWHALAIKLPAFQECNPEASTLRFNSPCSEDLWQYWLPAGKDLSACLHSDTVASVSAI